MTAFLRVVFPAVLPLAPTGRVDQAGRELRVVTTPFDVIVDLWDGRRFPLATIEAGFETDGASDPWWARPWCSPWDQSARAAVLHDWLLELRRRGLVGKPKMLLDLVFLVALVSTGVSFFRSLVLFFAVRTKP